MTNGGTNHYIFGINEDEAKKTKLSKEQITLIDIIGTLREQKREREAATHAYRLFRSLPEDDPFQPWRFFMFALWAHSFEGTSKDFKPIKDDRTAIGEVAMNPKEAKVIRCAAMYLLKHIYVNVMGQQEASQHWRNEIVRVGGMAKGMDQSVKFRGIHPVSDKQADPPSAGEIIDIYIKHVSNATNDDNALNANITFPTKRSDVIKVSKKRELIEFSTKDPISQDSSKFLLSEGGKRCDTCSKTAKECGIKRLFGCQRCDKSFYCSDECLKKKWNDGHKDFCRVAKEFKVGDFVTIGRGGGVFAENQIFIIASDKVKTTPFKHVRPLK